MPNAAPIPPADPAQLRRHGVASGALLQTACARIIAAEYSMAASRARFVIVVPNLHAVVSIAHTLHAMCAQPVLVLPRIVTLRSWAAQIDPGRDVLPPAAREAALYSALAERKWLADTDLWAVVAELGGLFDELTRWHASLPDDVEQFTLRLNAAYGARAGASFGFEARLIHALWRASQEGSSVDTETAYGLALARLASSVQAPIYAVGLGRLPPLEGQFLRRCAERVPVEIFDDDRMAARTDVARVLAAAWPRPMRYDLTVRARELRIALEQAPLQGRMRIFGAGSAEDEALAVAISVRRWLARGRRQIGVVVLDRVVARRARALLERADILVRDEAGWALSTTSAATVIGRWLDVVGNDFYHRDCLDLLKSPFIFHDCARDERQQAVWRFERALRKANLRSGLAAYIDLAIGAGDHELNRLLSRVARAERELARRRSKTINAWLQALMQSLVALGVRDGLAADAAGIELVALLDGLQADLQADRLQLGFVEWRRWLAGKLEGATFRDRGIDSPVVFTTLDASRLRQFDAVLLLGADAIRLPGQASAGMFFNRNVRRELGLPDRETHIADIEDALCDLISGCDDVLATWQRVRDGDENLLSPLIERLLTLHRLAFSVDLEDASLRDTVTAARRFDAGASMLAPCTRPAPNIPASRLPAAISASGYNALLGCPYQFYARYVLGLKDMDEVREEIEKADYGICVHAVLTDFHRAYPRIDTLTPAAAEQALVEFSMRGFRSLLASNYEASAWLALWLALVPRYIEWQRAREAEGWQFLAAEVDRQLDITTRGGRSFALRGRIDRVDRNASGAIAVLDYKTRAAAKLTSALAAPGEDVQLCVYALLWSGDVDAASYLSIDRAGVAAVDMQAHVGALAAQAHARLAAIYDAMADGAAMPAQGIDEVCDYCEMRGLCRKDYWIGVDR